MELLNERISGAIPMWRIGSVIGCLEGNRRGSEMNDRGETKGTTYCAALCLLQGKGAFGRFSIFDWWLTVG